MAFSRARIDKIAEFLEEIRSDLKEKWLDYYSANHLWIVSLNIPQQYGFKQNVDGVSRSLSRPSGEFILGVISALEPKLAQVLPSRFTISSEREKLVSVFRIRF